MLCPRAWPPQRDISQLRAISTLSWDEADAESGPETIGSQERRGNEPGSPWSWREGQKYLFEHCKSKASYVGRKASVMGNLAGEITGQELCFGYIQVFLTQQKCHSPREG